MPIEAFDNIDDLDPANPTVDDPVSEGDDHLRGIKNALQQNVTGDAGETRLLVAGVVAAVLDALAFTVKDLPLIDIDDSSVDEATQFLQRNLIGGWRMLNTTATANMQIDETDEAGVIQNQAALFTKGGGFTAYFAGAQAMRTVIGDAANSKGEVFDGAGEAFPIGFNLMPRVDGTTRAIAISDNGKRIRYASGGDLTLADTKNDFACNVYVNTASATNIIVPSGFTLRHYAGDQVRSLAGPLTLPMNAGTALTLVQFNTTIWEAWGGQLDGV